jgi:phage protein U
MQGYSNGPTVMMTLGEFRFGILTAAYNELARVTEYRWPAQERFGKRPSLQFTGPGPETITLPGVIYPEYRGGLGQINKLRELAGRGKPMSMISGRGLVMGRWVIERIEERQGVFAGEGVPSKIEFTLSLKRADDQSARKQ